MKYYKSICVYQLLALAIFPSVVSAASTTTIIVGGQGDGHIITQPYPGSWENQHKDTVGTGADSISQEALVAVSYHNSTTGYLSALRSFIPFDTSNLPAEANIESASLHIYANTVHDQYDDEYSWVNVFDGRQTSPNVLENADIDNCGDAVTQPTKGASDVDLTEVVAGQYISIELNATGIDWINPESYTKLCLREGHDAENIPLTVNDPDWKRSAIWWATSEAEEGKRPYLEITYTVEDEEPGGNSNVAFLPGITGSRLYTSQGGEDRRWEPFFWTDLAALVLHGDGESVRNDIYTRDIIAQAYLRTNLWNWGEAYDGFVTFMDDLVADDTINEWVPLQYDWRLSLDDIVTKGAVIHSSEEGDNVSYIESTTTPYLIYKLTHLADTAQNGKVTLVAHSMGGLVAKQLLKYLEETGNPLLEKIDQVLLVGTPQYGTPKALGELLHGTIPLARGASREAMENMPGVHLLLPSEDYFAEVGAAVARFDDSVAELTPYDSIPEGTEIATYTSMRSLLEGWNGAWSEPVPADLRTPNVISSSLLNRARSYHRALDSYAPSDIPVTELVGWGLGTPSSILYEDHCHGACANVLSATKRLPYRYQYTRKGDGTVIGESAAGDASGATYYIALDAANAAQNENIAHGTMLSNASVQSFIRNTVLLDEAVDEDYIFETVPTPSATRRWYDFLIFSPMNLHLHRGGQHTGLVSEGEEGSFSREYEAEIPNSYYEEWGDVKYIGAQADFIDEVELEGTGNGVFTLEINESGSDGLIRTLSYENVPVTDVTKGSLALPSGDAEGEMALDLDGNSSIDLTLAPGKALDTDGHYETLFAYLGTMDMPRWLKKWLKGRLFLAQKLSSQGKKKHTNAARALLKSVLRTISRQEGKRISEVDAALLRTHVQQLIEEL